MEIINRTIDYIEGWLKVQESNQNIVPVVKKILVVLKWKRDALSEIPENIKEKIPAVFISKEHDQNENKSIAEALPIPEQANSDRLSIILNNTVAGSSSVFSPLGIIDSLDSEVSAWAVKVFETFEKVEEEIDTPLEVRRLLFEHFPEIIDEYDLIESNYYKSTTQLELRVNACTAMRNLVEHFRGLMFKKAMRKHEQKMSWSLMTERLCSGSAGSFEYELLINEEKNYDSIHLNLTNYFKNRDKCTSDSVKRERTKLLAHLFSVITLIRK